MSRVVLTSTVIELATQVMSEPDYDVIILGQGLAGTTLAWNLHWLGRRILIVDRGHAGTSSRIAAGLMTPITGQRLVQSWRWDQFWKAAQHFYCHVEAETGAHFFDPRKMVRLLASESEQDFLKRRLASEFAHLITQPRFLLDPQYFDCGLGGFEMNEGGRLDVAAFLDASRQYFHQEAQFATADLELQRDIDYSTEGVSLKPLGVSARHLIFCQGIDAVDNPWFQHVSFKPAKGEILTVRIRGLEEHRIVHRGVWLMPLGHEMYRAGATYEWRQLDSEPTVDGREEICSRLREFLRLPVEVIAHHAAVRPILRHQYPIVGMHPVQQRLGYFNGLGSKGSLQAPWLAHHFANVLAGKAELDPEVDMHLYESRSRGHR